MQSSLQVGVNGQAVWVRVEGRGTFQNSGSFKQFTQEMVKRGYREFFVDLDHCAMLDSTFMGTMAGVALRLKEMGEGDLHVVHCGQRSFELLSGLGLDQIFEIRANGFEAPQCQALPAATTTEQSEDPKQAQARTMLDAHEALCTAAPENFLRFKDVLEYLRQDLHAETAAN